MYYQCLEYTKRTRGFRLVPPGTVSCGTSCGCKNMIKYCVIIFIGVPHNEAYRAFKSRCLYV